jgi:hypothetical protein
MHSPLVHGGICGLVQMISHLRRGRVRGCLAAALLFAACGWFSTPPAQAGCSQHTTAKANSARSQFPALDRLFFVSTASADFWQRSPLEPFPARPCSGFRCSRDSSPPLGVPQGAPRHDSWGCVIQHAYSPLDRSSSFPFDEDCPSTLDRVERLARPPR